MVEVRQDEPAEALALVEVRVPRQDEGVDAELHVPLELGPDLVGVAHDRRPAAASGPPDAGPQVVLHVPLVAGAVTTGIPAENWQAALAEALAGQPLRAAVDEITQAYGLKRKEVYDAALALKAQQ